MDAIISGGYRVNSKKESVIRKNKGQSLLAFPDNYTVFDIETTGLDSKYDEKYFYELLERIKTIRVSERMSYKKITDIYATSVDYDSKSLTTIKFLKKVQNKMHYAVSHQTVAEIIYNKADAEKEYMGLTNWLNCTK